MVPLEPAEVQYKVDHSNAAANLAARDAGESRWILPGSTWADDVDR
jgi:hypothetical protein